MYPIFNGCEDTAVWSWPYSFSFFFVCGDGEVYKEKVKTRDDLVARIMNSAALIKQERQDDLKRDTITIAKRVEKCTGVDGGIF